MNRRSALIGTGLVFSGTLAGCFATDDTGESPTTSDVGSNESGSTGNESGELGCPAVGHLDISFVPEIPDEESILNAEAEQITDVAYLAKALSKARSEYDELNQTERDERIHLAKVEGEDVADESRDITDKIGYGGEAYVEHEGVVYSMMYNEQVC